MDEGKDGGQAVDAFTITVSLVSGSTGRVDLSISDWPGNVGTYGFNPPYGYPDFTSILQIRVLDNAPTGTYTLTIVGSGGGKTESTTVTI